MMPLGWGTLRSAGFFLVVSESFTPAGRQLRHVKSRRQVRGNRQIAAKSFDQCGSGGLNGFDVAVRIDKAACLFAAGIEFDLIGFGIDPAR
ncbi:hypothetical protein [Mesorhizobium sp.]|uniref:hypothetical protein n=1 Tax=Mesorhizobium sp. TaxID=1871066 RepID=UPI0025D7A1D5|nr:hypothetical protein [Mesorhizobium sp.]